MVCGMDGEAKADKSIADTIAAAKSVSKLKGLTRGFKPGLPEKAVTATGPHPEGAASYSTIEWTASTAALTQSSLAAGMRP
jgi:hypothetical protein